jgi:hypothetical protein
MEPGKVGSGQIPPSLTDDQVRELRKIYRFARRMAKRRGQRCIRDGLAVELGVRYGVTKRTIIRAWNKTHYRHIK